MRNGIVIKLDMNGKRIKFNKLKMAWFIRRTERMKKKQKKEKDNDAKDKG